MLLNPAQKGQNKSARSLKVKGFLAFHLVTVLQQHPGCWELVNGVKVKCARGSKVWGFGDFLRERKKLVGKRNLPVCFKSTKSALISLHGISKSS